MYLLNELGIIICVVLLLLITLKFFGKSERQEDYGQTMLFLAKDVDEIFYDN